MIDTSQTNRNDRYVTN